MTITPGTPLYHVGCGQRLYDYQPDQMMAISCDCGALAPIMALHLDDPAESVIGLPASLVLGVQEKTQLAHLEYYLGFSSFSCPVKEAWEKALRKLGSTSMAECTESRCQEYASRMQARAHGESR